MAEQMSRHDTSTFFFFTKSVYFHKLSLKLRIGGVIVSMLASIVGSSPSQVKPKTIKLVFIASLPSTHLIRRKSKEWLPRNPDNVSELGDMSFSDCCFSEPAL